MNLLMIHGRSQQGKDPAILQKYWEQALSQGLKNAGLNRPDNIQVAFPFYGDKLDSLIEQLDAPMMTDIVARGDNTTSGDLAFRAEMYAEIATRVGISDNEIQTKLKPGPQERGPLNWNWVQAILKTLDRTPLGGAAIDEFTRDVYVYLTNQVVRQQIDKIVSEKLSKGKWVVVAHSLGTIVGYNVLRAENGNDIEVSSYITLGSPLGINAVRTRLDSPLEMPVCAKSWYNARDKRDVVALFPLDANNFNIKPAITNNNNVDNFTENRHSIEGYLSNADVARKIVSALQT
jgi:hypothetical protein